jgi:hypothetical protein
MTAGGPLTTVIVDALRAAAATSVGAAVVSHHDEDFELDVEGEEPVVARFQTGAITIEPVGSTAPRPFSYTRIRFRRAGVESLVAGLHSPAEAAEEGLIEIQSRLYGGGQVTRLLAIAQHDDLFETSRE